MKERPILFSGPMVRAILSGQKTVTRREVKKRNALDCLAAGFEPSFLTLSGNADMCPYGQVGDRLWVRETFSRSNPGGDDGVYFYRADGRFPSAMGGGCFYGDEIWKPSIHMPRFASRILLEVTNVRVERLQAITWEEALDEGISDHRFECDRPVEPDGYPACSCGSVGYVDAFAELWNSINGTGAWEANPWVWVVEFKRIEP